MTPFPTATPSGYIHIGDLDGKGTWIVRKVTWKASVTVLVHNAAERAAANATVSGNWSEGTIPSGSCVTGTKGTCTISSGGLGTAIQNVKFTVSDVAHASFAYNAAANHDIDGGTNGTAITVNKP
jgi:hypothetical protein